MLCSRAIFCLILWLPSLMSQGNTKYCTEFACGRKHIACNNEGKPSNLCSPDTRLITMAHVKYEIVDIHNTLRNYVASGQLVGSQEQLLPAVRMASMSWDGDLAEMATLKVLQCTNTPDYCHSTKKFPTPGQNVAYYTYTSPKGTVKLHNIILNILNDWFNEGVDVLMDDIYKYSTATDIGHFAVMIVDHSTHIGCAASEFTYYTTTYVLFVCNYAQNLVVGENIYRAGYRAADECKTDINSRFPNLCSEDEVY